MSKIKGAFILLLLSSVCHAATVIQDGDGQRIYADDGSVIIQGSAGSSIAQANPGRHSSIIANGSSVYTSGGSSVMVVNGVKIVVNDYGDVTVNGKKCEYPK